MAVLTAISIDNLQLITEKYLINIIKNVQVGIIIIHNFKTNETVKLLNLSQN